MESIKIMYIEVSDPSLSKRAFDDLESRFANLRGRKFYGIVFPTKYWAAVKAEPNDDPVKLRLNVGEIPGGEYVKEVVSDWINHIPEIKSTFAKMAQEHKRDPERPEIEFYRSQKELQLWMPTK